MTAVAYYRSWSKRVEKPVAAHGSPPTTDERGTDPVPQHPKALEQSRRKSA